MVHRRPRAEPVTRLLNPLLLKKDSTDSGSAFSAFIPGEDWELLHHKHLQICPNLVRLDKKVLFIFLIIKLIYLCC